MHEKCKLHFMSQGESTVFKAHESSVRSVQFSNDGRHAQYSIRHINV